MPDNLLTQTAALASLPTNANLACRVGTYSGGTAYVAPVGLVEFSGLDNAKVITDVPIGSIIGAALEAAPATDTASSGLNGRLQRIAQRITSLLAVLPGALTGSGNFKVAIVEDTVGGTVDTDDGSVAGGQAAVPLTIGFPHRWNGAAWIRGGWTPSRIISAASNNATVVKASAGVLGFVSVSNLNAAVRYLKIYDKATAPAPGSDIAKIVVAIPTGSVPVNLALPDEGIAFAAGISFALVTGILDNDNTGVAASEILVNLGYL